MKSSKTNLKAIVLAGMMMLSLGACGKQTAPAVDQPADQVQETEVAAVAEETEVVTAETEQSEEDNSQIVMSVGASVFRGMKLEDAEAKFTEMGFSDFAYDTVETENELLDGSVCYVEISGEEGSTLTFVKTNTFAADSKITFFVYKLAE